MASESRRSETADEPIPDQRKFLTNPEEFTDVSRGNPVPHTLTRRRPGQARLTPETWRLEIVAEGGAKIDDPKRLDDGTALDLPRLLGPGRTAWRRFLQGDAVQQHRPAAGPGAVGGRAAPRRACDWPARCDNVRRVLLLGLPQQRPQADVPLVAGHQPGARHAAWRAAAVRRLSAQRRSRSRSSAAGRCAWSSPGLTASSRSSGCSASRSPTTTRRNDTYALQNNDPESYLKTAAYFDDPERSSFRRRPARAIRGTAMVGWPGLERVEYWLRPEAGTHGHIADDDPGLEERPSGSRARSSRRRRLGRRPARRRHASAGLGLRPRRQAPGVADALQRCALVASGSRA